MRTIDDRRKRVHLEKLPHGWMKHSAKLPLKLNDIQVERMRRAEMPSFLTMIGVLVLAFSFFTSGLHRVPSKWMCAMPFAILIILGLAIKYSVRRLDRIYSLHYLPMHLICAACGHSLEGLPQQPDGCTVCPECGAAWKVPVI